MSKYTDIFELREKEPEMLRKGKRAINKDLLILLFFVLISCVIEGRLYGEGMDLINYSRCSVSPRPFFRSLNTQIILCSDNADEKIKEFPHDLYHNEKEENKKNKDSKNETKGQERNETNIQVNINIIDDTKSSDKEGPKEKDVKKMFPDPPEDISKNAEDLLWYYLDRWINSDYKAMYGAITNRAQKKYTFQKFCDLYQREEDVNGGLVSAKLIGDKKQRGPLYEFEVELMFRNEKVPNRKVKGLLQYTPKGYRLDDCGLIPLDYKNL